MMKNTKTYRILRLIFLLLFFCTSSALFARKSEVCYSVKKLKGTPTIFVNDKPLFSCIGVFGLPQEKLIRDFQKNGLHIYHMYGARFCESPKKILDRLAEVVRIDPQARFIIRIELMLSVKDAKKYDFIAKWFAENPPGEKGENQVSWRKLRTRPDDDKMFSEFPSVASAKWLDYALPRYAAYIDALEKSEFGPRIMAYWPCYQEGNYAYSFGGPVMFSDYSTPMIRFFRKFLREKYKNNVSLLRKAWNKTNITFENAEAPTPLERLNSSTLSLRDTGKFQPVIDFEEALSEAITTHILLFISKTKEVTNRRKLVGTYTGYLSSWLNCHPDWQKRGVLSYKQTQGYCAALRYYNSPDVDFIGSPHSYLYRGSGDPFVMNIPAASWKLRDKLFIWEDDTRTSVMALFDVWGSCKTASESVQVLKRNFGYNLANGFMSWIPGHIFGYSGSDDPAIMEFHGKAQEIVEKSLKFPRNVRSEVAIVFDDKSLLRFGIQPQVCAPLMDELEANLSRAGIGYDSILLADMADPRLKDYKFYIFSNTIYIQPEMQKIIKKKLAKNNATVLWMYAPGYVADGHFSKENVFSLTGMKIKVENRMAREHLRLKDNAAGMQSVKQRTVWNDTDPSRKPWGPCISLEEEGIEILGVKHENGHPCFGYRKHDGYHSYYCTVPNPGWEVLRNLAEKAKIHVWNKDGDYVIPAENFLVVHALSTGKKKFSLPQKMDVYEVFQERAVGNGISSFSEYMEKGTTRIYFIGKRSDWKPGKPLADYQEPKNDLRIRNLEFIRKPDSRKCMMLDLEKFVTHYSTDAGDKKGIAAIPTGNKVLAGVPFFLRSPSSGPVCILLRGKQFPHLPNSTDMIPVGKKVSYFYFLHHAGWMNSDYKGITMEYIIHYSDGSTVSVPIRPHAEIADSVNGGNLRVTGLGNKETKVAAIYKASKRYPNSALYAYRWKNPQKTKSVKGITISTKNNAGIAVPAVFAITAELAE